MSAFTMLKRLLYALIGVVILYFLFLSILTIPFCQNQVIYLNSVVLTWFQNVNVPEQWGFLHNQVTPFNLETPDGETLHAWHILPLEVYRRNEDSLIEEPSGLAPEITSRLSFKLLRDDSDALLVLYLHGAAGTLGSGYRPPSYRALYAAASGKIHTGAIDYRGFGTSTGSASESGLLKDAVTLAEWAMNEAKIPPSRIVLFGQSLGTAVTISLMHHMATRPEPVYFAGTVLVAPFANVELLTSTYRVGGTIPILSPLARFPKLLAFFNSMIVAKWPSKDKLSDFIRHSEDTTGTSRKYDITIIHAEDDYDIPWIHSEEVFRYAANATLPLPISHEEFVERKEKLRKPLGAGGWRVQWEGSRGVIREQIVKYGLHDVIMSHPVVSAAVWRAFHSKHSALGPFQ